jgi:hypothetical protein
MIEAVSLLVAVLLQLVSWLQIMEEKDGHWDLGECFYCWYAGFYFHQLIIWKLADRRRVGMEVLLD